MYSKITIYGECDINYLKVQRGVSQDTEINDVIAQGIYLPTWDENSIMVSTYQNSVDATPLSLSDGTVIGYKIQRKDVNHNKLNTVVQTPYAQINDYNVCGNRTYQYYIFPIIEKNGIKTLGKPIVTDEIVPKWNLCTIAGLIATDEPNIYQVDTKNIWRLQLNVELEKYDLNTDKTFTDGFDRFSKRTQGIKKYLSGGLSSIVGMLNHMETDINITVNDVERWEDFCYSSNLKLYNDMHGRIIPIDIKSVSTGYLTSSEDSPIVTNISFIQLADANDISVYGLDGV